jgi:hypothetical protein
MNISKLKWMVSQPKYSEHTMPQLLYKKVFFMILIIKQKLPKFNLKLINRTR